jgi:hypothetical protein
MPAGPRYGAARAAGAELVAQLQRLGPAWGELRGVLNDVNRVLGES